MPQVVAMTGVTSTASVVLNGVTGAQQVALTGSVAQRGATGLQGIQGPPASNLVTSVNGRQGIVAGLAEDNAVMHDTGNEVVTGIKQFTNGIVLPDFNGVLWLVTVNTDGSLQTSPTAVEITDPGNGEEVVTGLGYPFGLLFGATLISGTGEPSGSTGGSGYPFGLSMGVTLL